ncbi:pyridoxal phosphate-dependent aminotransferase [Bacillus luteolus]|uniref:cysteine-S-conjugate beta-lyase n=1 Tax=Litchfieldia luteola TaxID=682179 RepID=A0ABR9QG41_9BACI|nr:MalY/PatB family protein [Cytobacillus luteolus]MBE4907466.1 pyridoxal phosphate-dependent aminotransferase [Cytobacillus luteolus]
MNFDNEISRKGTNSVKWDINERVFGTKDVLPMWVADMDFQAPEIVVKELAQKVNHGIFGYSIPMVETSEAITGWLKRRHQWVVNSSSITYSPGVVFAISMVIQEYTSPGDKILIQSPIYTPFFEMIEKNNRTVLNSPLILKNNRYYIDFDDLEKNLDPSVKLFLLCNPHNPGGRVWTREELIRLGQICLKHNILIVSDEIHSDLIIGDQPHIPFASISEEFANQSITLIAPSKTFNLAGLQASATIIPNRSLRTRFDKRQQQQGFFTLGTFGIIGMEAAYLHGDEWLDNLIEYLRKNVSYLMNFIESNLPKVKVIRPDASYLVWLDCRELGLTDSELKDVLIKKGKLGLEPGTKYGPGGEGFVRINIGCPISTLKEGLNRLKVALS